MRIGTDRTVGQGRVGVGRGLAGDGMACRAGEDGKGDGEDCNWCGLACREGSG